MLSNLLLGSVIRGALGARHKPHHRAARFLTGGSSFMNLGTLVGAAGLAWGAYEHFKTRSPQSSTTVEGGFGPSLESSGPPPLPTMPPPLPTASAATVASEPTEREALRRLVALTVGAAKCDGQLSEEEYGRVMESAREAGADELVLEEMRSPRPLAQVVAGTTEPKLKSDLYVLAFGIVRADGNVFAAERAWLAQLAGLLGIDAITVARLEKETAERIDKTGS